MDRFDRIYALHKMLVRARVPVARRQLEAAFECSAATVKRLIEDMRLHLDAPIRYDRARNGYHYAPSADGGRYELPGLWFNAGEVYALLACQQLLENIEPGLLGTELTPLRSRIGKLLSAGHSTQGELSRRVRLLAMAKRKSAISFFTPVASALTLRRRLWLAYHGRARDDCSERTISPQRLVHYRDNWYLDAWDHEREALRTFAMERIQSARPLPDAALDVPEAELDATLGAAYGIFSGPPQAEAVLRFSAHQARWVADETWHSEQRSAWLPDGRYELRVPFGDPRELVMDILKFGPEVEVVAPPALREEVKQRLLAAAAIYG